MRSSESADADRHDEESLSGPGESDQAQNVTVEPSVIQEIKPLNTHTAAVSSHSFSPTHDLPLDTQIESQPDPPAPEASPHNPSSATDPTESSAAGLAKPDLEAPTPTSDHDSSVASRRISIPRPSHHSRPSLMMQLADLKLHSPSEIIGTPFVDSVSSPFEYPFPESSGSSAGTPSPPAGSPVGPSSLVASLSASSITGPNVSPPSSGGLDPSVFPSSSSFFPPPPELAPARGKTRIATESVPVPPGVQEKRKRWSLNMRKGSESSDQSAPASGGFPLRIWRRRRADESPASSPTSESGPSRR